MAAQSQDNGKQVPRMANIVSRIAAYLLAKYAKGNASG